MAPNHVAFDMSPILVLHGHSRACHMYTHLSDTKGRTFGQVEAICMWMRLSPVVAQREWFISLTTLQRVTYSWLELRSTEDHAKWKAGLLCWGNKKSLLFQSCLVWEDLGAGDAANERVERLHFLLWFLAERICFWRGYGILKAGI